jgi:hypothetical protein
MNSDIITYFNDMITYAVSKYEQRIKDVELDYSTYIEKTEYSNENGIEQVSIEYILNVDFYPDEDKYQSLNHLKLKKPIIIEIVSDHTSNRRFLTDMIVQYTGYRRLSFSTNMGFFPDPWFNEFLKRKP